MWYYNNVKRHLFDVYVAFMWFKEKRTIVGRPRSGKITPAALEWAKQINRVK
jgi:hypothetical protein